MRLQQAAAREQEAKPQAGSGTARRRVWVCAGTDWDGHPSTLTHLFRVIAAEEPVIWINSIGLRAPRLERRDLRRLVAKGRAGWMSARQPSAPRLGGPQAIIEPRAIPYHQYGLVRRLNAALLERQLRPHLARWPDADIVFVATNPAAVSLVEPLGPAVAIYYCLDEYAEMADCDREIVRGCEELMLEAVDCTLATSLALCRAKRSLRYETLHLPQGVDFAHFQRPGPCPAPLLSVPRPILGFFGIVGDRVDLTLFEKILARFPGASLVALGRAEADLAPLRRYRNFFHFDAVPYGQLPAWGCRFDAGLIAYRPDGHMAAINPLKLLEYLAMGLPVVSVALPELARHAEHVEIARDHDEYLAAIGRLLARGPVGHAEKERRRAYAAANSWHRRAAEFRRVCDDLLARRGCPG